MVRSGLGRAEDSGWKVVRTGRRERYKGFRVEGGCVWIGSSGGWRVVRGEWTATGFEVRGTKKVCSQRPTVITGQSPFLRGREAYFHVSLVAVDEGCACLCVYNRLVCAVCWLLSWQSYYVGMFFLFVIRALRFCGL